MMFFLGRALQFVGLCGVGLVLILNLMPDGLTMETMLLLTAFSVLLFYLGTTLLKGEP